MADERAMWLSISTRKIFSKTKFHYSRFDFEFEYNRDVSDAQVSSSIALPISFFSDSDDSNFSRCKRAEDGMLSHSAYVAEHFYRLYFPLDRDFLGDIVFLSSSQWRLAVYDSFWCQFTLTPSGRKHSKVDFLLKNGNVLDLRGVLCRFLRWVQIPTCILM
jgi:hypothetical protein